MEMHISHILVQHQYEAEDLLRKISEDKAKEAGLPQTFAHLAKQFSKCPSSKSGGDLGKIALSRLVPEFSEVAQTLEVGEMSGIVKTQFGYHLIFRNA